MSLSARRAWIEIHNHLLRTIPRIVALRKESVDRNRDAGGTESIYNESLSARRAWIEINRPKNQREKQEGRSPQGERG